MFVCVTTSGQTNLRASWDVAIESTEHHLGSAFKAKKKKKPESNQGFDSNSQKKEL